MSAGEVKFARVRVSEVRAHSTNVRKNLGDLRDLCASIEELGVLEPIHVEQWDDHWRLRDGHRRHAAATILHLTRIPAVIHTDCLDDDEWLTAAVHHNQRRRQLDRSDRAHTVLAMRDAGKSWEGVARDFGVSTKTVRSWVEPRTPSTTPRRLSRVSVRSLADVTTAWRHELKAGHVDVDDFLDALDRITTTGQIQHCYPPREQEAS